MSSDLDFPKLDPAQRRAGTSTHLLALSGGGYRGLFTARILDAFERDSGGITAHRFDAIAGTSIGGILAIGLANKIPAADLAAMIREHGSAIFRRSGGLLPGLSHVRYSPDSLRLAVETILGRPAARQPFAEIPAPLIVCAVDEVTSRPRLFRTAMVDPDSTDTMPTIDVALATSAAPTFFPAHRIDGRAHVDGGLMANAPDLALVTEWMRLNGGTPDRLHLLSIGTAGSRRNGNAPLTAGKVGWVARHGLVQLIMGAQEEFAVMQTRTLGLGTFLRIDETPERPIALDRVDEASSALLESLAGAAIERTRAERGGDWRRFGAYLSPAYNS